MATKKTVANIDIPEGVFLDYQNELLETLPKSEVLVVEKSRRTGYSWTASAMAVLIAAAAQSAGGTDILYMSYDKEITREFIEYAGDWAKLFGEVSSDIQEEIFKDPDNPDKEMTKFRITFASGFKILALPSVPRVLRGQQGVVILDEAAFYDDLEAVLTAALALLMWGGKVLVISTHKGEDNQFNILINEIRSGQKPDTYKVLRCDLKRAREEGLYSRVALKHSLPQTFEAEQDWYDKIVATYGSLGDEELFCIPSKGSGAFMSSGLVSSCAVEGIPVLRLEKEDDFIDRSEDWRKAEINDWLEEYVAPILQSLDKNLPSYFGQDFARSGDLSVLWPLQLDNAMNRNTPFVTEMRNIPFENQRQILFYTLDRLPRFSGGAMDAGGNGSYLAEVAYQRYGNIERVNFSTSWYREEMPPYKTAYEDKSITIPKDQDIIFDHRMIVMQGGVAKIPADQRRKGTDGKMRHGDAAIAGALSYYASRQEFFEYGYETVNERPRGATDPDYRDASLKMNADDQYHDSDNGFFNSGAF